MSGDIAKARPALVKTREAALRDQHQRDPERLTKAAVEDVASARCLRQPTLDPLIGRAALPALSKFRSTAS